MTGRQDQRAAAGATAIQSQRDTVIHEGLNADDMKAIVESLADQMPKLVAAAAAMIEVRLKSFETDIMRRFEEDASAKREAFSDPDFQHVVLEAQRAYARTGDTGTHETLVDLIAKRSSQETGSRRAFTVNEAITIVARLTRSELSELAFSFYMRSVQNYSINSIVSFCNDLNQYIDEFLDDIELERQSYEYLVSQRCVTISLGEISLIEIFKRTYPALFMAGFSADDVQRLADETSSDIRAMLVKSVVDDQRLQPGGMTLEVWQGMDRPAAITDDHLKTAWERAVSNLVDDDTITQKLRPHCPRLDELINKWSSSPMKSLDLTSIGKAIGHARLTGLKAFGKPDLGIWIK